MCPITLTRLRSRLLYAIRIAISKAFPLVSTFESTNSLSMVRRFLFLLRSENSFKGHPRFVDDAEDAKVSIKPTPKP